MKPLVSIIMSTLNTPADYLINSINSILNQDYRNFEFIIIIDGGNDEDIINNNFNDQRIKIIKHVTSKGLPFSLNEAISLSNGKYIARMDSDDISNKDRLTKQVEFLEANPNIDVVATYYQRFGIENKKVKEKYIYSSDVKCKLFFVNCIAHPTVMFKKSSNLHYDENYLYSQDYELWTRNINTNVAILPIIGLKYRIHNNQVSSTKKEKQFELYKSILIRNLKRLDLNQSDITYQLALNGNNNSVSISELLEFINRVLIQNKKYNYYDENRLKNILLRQLEIYCIKNKKVLNRIFFKNIKYLFR